MRRVFSEEKYRESIGYIDKTNVNKKLIHQCNGREADMLKGVVVGRDGEEYKVSLTWLVEVGGNSDG